MGLVPLRNPVPFRHRENGEHKNDEKKHPKRQNHGKGSFIFHLLKQNLHQSKIHNAKKDASGFRSSFSDLEIAEKIEKQQHLHK
jgi:hypothetical protein